MPRSGPAVVPPSRRRFRWLEPLLCGRCAKQPRGSTPAEGRAESVPEAGGGTGAAAVATPTTPPAGHAADSPANRRPRPEGIGGRADSPPANAAGAEVFRGDRRGAAAPPRQPAVIPGVCWLVSTNHADSRVICMTGSRGRPGLLSARRGERSEPERALNRDGGRIDMLAGRKGPWSSVVATVLPNVLNGYTSIEARTTSTGEGKNT